MRLKEKEEKNNEKYDLILKKLEKYKDYDYCHPFSEFDEDDNEIIIIQEDI